MIKKCKQNFFQYEFNVITYFLPYILISNMITKPKTIKTNCNNPGTRFDFSLKRTSNTTMYRIVPAAKPRKIKSIHY